ncbi:MAG: hypothetical protein H0V96_11635 [Acidimicrobiia bacterium]|nr:hypothetical protein [Acidimicrobiia bacterium]
MTKRLWILLGAMLLVLAACGGDDDDAADTTLGAADTTAAPADTTAAPGGTTAAPAGEATLSVASSDLGDVLADQNGVTLYLFTNDTQDSGESTCAGDCAATWPAFPAPAAAGDGVDEALVGTIPGAEGGEQVTYNGWPLYYFAGDSGPNQTNGQGVGGVWFVVTPAGEAVPAG